VKGYGKRKIASHALNEEDEEFLWQSGQLGKHSAQALVNVNFKNVSEHFGLRGRQEHYSMTVEDVSIITSPDSVVKQKRGKEVSGSPTELYNPKCFRLAAKNAL